MGKTENIDILAVQETMIEDDTKWRGDKYTWFFASGVTGDAREYRKNRRTRQE